MMPLGLKGIVDKIKKAFYESDSTKIVITNLKKIKLKKKNF